MSDPLARTSLLPIPKDRWRRIEYAAGLMQEGLSVVEALNVADFILLLEQQNTLPFEILTRETQPTFPLDPTP